MEKPLVSIIVPCYNQGQYLTEALESVEVQTYSNWECVIVDDGSTDNSKEVALIYCNRDRRFKYIYQENQGPSVARNNAIKKSRGEYILPLDGDDKIHEDYLKSAVEILINRDDVKIVNCRVELFGYSSGEWKLPDFNLDDFMQYNQIVCTAMFRRRDYDQTNGYNPNMREGLEDWDFWLSLLETGGNVFTIPHTYFFYRIKESSRNIDSMQKETYNRLIVTVVANHPAFYREQYNSLLIKNKKLSNKLSYYKNSYFWRFFYWLRNKEDQWINFKVYIYNILHRK